MNGKELEARLAALEQATRALGKSKQKWGFSVSAKPILWTCGLWNAKRATDTQGSPTSRTETAS